jgi:hypothetical protein
LNSLRQPGYATLGIAGQAPVLYVAIVTSLVGVPAVALGV